MSGDELVRSFTAFVRAHQLFDSDDRLLVAVSGGKDSTVLVHLLLELDYPISLVHCNFQLRGAASESDEQFLRALADRHQLPIYVRRVDTVVEAEIGESVQMTARRVRYFHFQKILDEYNLDTVVTAHQLEDSFETALINLLRGTGLTGLHGISPINGRIVRPLLESSRAKIDAYARDRQIEWREDASNASNDYLRNRVRHRLLPVFQELGLTATSLARTLQTLREETTLLSYGYRWWEDRIMERTAGTITIDRRPLETLPDSTVQLLLSRLLGTGDFTPEQLRQLVSIRGSGSISGVSVTAYITPHSFRITPTGEVQRRELVSIPALPFAYNAPEGSYTFEAVERPNQLNEPDSQYLRLPEFPLHLRPRRKGDRMAPLGMGGQRKKLKKVFQDLGLTGPERERQLLLCAPDGTILAILGHRIAEPARVRPEDDRVLRISWEHKSPGTG